ncbi:MAG: MFS transporter [Candidatus Sulfotelmatobacter sp.]
MPSPPAEREPSPARNIYAFGFTSFLNDTATEMAYWVLPAFLVSLGAGPAQLGLIEGVAESVASFAKLFSGYLTDRIDRRKPLVVAGYFVANAVKPILALATSWWHILLIRFTDRLAKGVRGAPRDVMVAESVPKGRLGAAYGLIQSMDSAGAIAGPLVAFVLLEHHGMRTVFWAAAVPGALCVLVALFGICEKRRSQTVNGTGFQPEKVVTAQSTSALVNAATTSGAVKLPAAFYFVLFAVTLFSLGNSSDMFLVMRAQNEGIPVALAPLLGLVFNLTYTLGSWPAGWFSDHVSRRASRQGSSRSGSSRRWIAAAGYLIFAAVYFVFGRAPSALAIWIAMAVYGFYYALTQPVLKALVVEAVGESVRGRALGVYFFVTSVATLAASLITGELWKQYGAAIPFYFSAAMAVASAMLLAFPRHFLTGKTAPIG